MKRFLCLILLPALLSSCRKEVVDVTPLKNINLITSASAHGFEDQSGYDHDAFYICFNDDELDFWQKYLWIEIESLDGLETKFADGSDVMTNYGGRVNKVYEIQEFPNTSGKNNDYKYCLESRLDLSEPGTYKFRFKIYEVERTYEYYTQDFELIVHEKVQGDELSYWTELL